MEHIHQYKNTETEQYATPDELDAVIADVLDKQNMSFEYADSTDLQRTYKKAFLYGDVPIQMEVSNALNIYSRSEENQWIYTFSLAEATASERIVFTSKLSYQPGAQTPGYIETSINKEGGRAEGRVRLPKGMGKRIYEQYIAQTLPKLVQEFGVDMEHAVVEAPSISDGMPLTHQAWQDIFEPILVQNEYTLDEALSSDKKHVWRKMYHAA